MSDFACDDRIAGSDRKIDLTPRAHIESDCTPNDNGRVEIGPTQLAFDEWQAAGIVPPDLPVLRAYRLQRLQEQIRKHDRGAVPLSNYRYESAMLA